MATKLHVRYFHGRKIVEDAYPLAKDRREIWRLNLQHRLVKKALGRRNFCAPVRNPESILDIACGTGIWCLEVARHFRQAQTVVGIDKHLELTEALLHIQRNQRAIPDSLAFQQADALQPLAYETNQFDFVHGRFMAPFIPLSRWSQVLSELVRVTKSGGWIEVAEAELSANNGPLLQEVNQALEALAEKLGIGAVGTQIPDWLRNANVSQVQSRRILLEGKDLAKNVAEAMHSFTPALLHTGVITKERLATILAGFEQEVQLHGIKVPVVIAWGQKP